MPPRSRAPRPPRKPAAMPVRPVSLEPDRIPRPDVLHVAPLETLARVTTETARTVERAVFQERRRADRAIALALRNRRDLATPDHRFIARSIFSLFRWHGWVEPLRLPSLEERLLLSCLLDAPSVHPVCRVWAKSMQRDAGRLVAMGDAPGWTARAEALKRWVDGRSINADPWRLFPSFLRAISSPLAFWHRRGEIQIFWRSLTRSSSVPSSGFAFSRATRCRSGKSSARQA